MQLAHANVSKLRLPIDNPEMASLVRALGDVNWLAEQSPGFVWRHRPEGPTTPATLRGAGDVIITISVWEGYDALQAYVYRSAHALFMQRRVRWFVPMAGYTTVLWWVGDGEHPAVDDALARLEDLRAHGPAPHAFSLRNQFGPEGTSTDRRARR